MKTFFCCLFSFCFAMTGVAQKQYFIYLQAETNTPFYVKMGDQVHSGGSGYLILPNLIDSTYNFSVGFPSTGAESRFSVSISGKDRGFLIKKFDYGLGLFDLQTLSVIRPQVDESQKNISYRTRNDDFTALLAKASHDSSLLFVPVVMKEEVVVQKQEVNKEEANPVKEAQTNKATTIIIPPQTDITETKKTDPPVEERNKNNNPDSLMTFKKDVVDTTAVVKQNQEKISIDSSTVSTSTAVVDLSATNPPYKRSQIKKHSESSTSEGFGLVFYDNYDGGADTIRLIIPNPKIILKEPGDVETVDNSDSKKDSIVQPKVVVTPTTKSGIEVKSNCKSTASESDFFKLRKNMAGRNSDDAMVGEAKKVFKSKCFTTEQVRNLGTLFLTSAGKYQFFDAAYLHVTDREKFGVLESELKDDYYVKRFKALVGE